MAIAGELFTTSIKLDNRTYFFNVKENRNKDVFLQVVESKGAYPDSKSQEYSPMRTQIAIFESDMQKFLTGLNESLAFIEKNRKARQKLRAEKDARYSKKPFSKSPRAEKDLTVKPKKTGKIHVVSKLPPPAQEESPAASDNSPNPPPTTLTPEIAPSQ